MLVYSLLEVILWFIGIFTLGTGLGLAMGDKLDKGSTLFSIGILIMLVAYMF